LNSHPEEFDPDDWEPAPADRLCERAEALIEIRRPAEALPLLHEALRADPSHLEAHCLLSWAQANLGAASDALKAAEAAVALAPEEEWGHRLRANALFQSGRSADALEAAQEAARCDPNDLDVIWTVAHCARENGQLDLAREWAERALELYPGHPAGHVLLAGVAQDEKQWPAAEAHLITALEINPADANVLHDMGLVLRAQGRRREAVFYFHQAAQLEPEDSSLNYLFMTAAGYDRAGCLGRLGVALSAVACVWLLERRSDLSLWQACGIVALFYGAGVWLWSRYWLATLPPSIARFYPEHRRRFFRTMWGLATECARVVGEEARKLKTGAPERDELAADIASLRTDLWDFVRLATTLVGAVGGCLFLVIAPIVGILFGKGDCGSYLLVMLVTVWCWVRINREVPDEQPTDTVDTSVPPTGGGPESAPPPGAPAPDGWPALGVSPDAGSPGCLVPALHLAYAAPARVDAVLGAPAKVSPISSHAAHMPGELRDYLLRDGSEALVRFYQGHAVGFSVQRAVGAGPTDPAEAVGDCFGIDVRHLVTERVTPRAQVWYGTLGEVSLTRVSAARQGRDGSANRAAYNFAEVELGGGSRPPPRRR